MDIIDQAVKRMHFKKGNRLYFYESELETWLKAGQKLTREQLDNLSDIYLKR